MSETTVLVLNTMTSLFVAIIVIIFIVVLFADLKPYEQISFANTEKLRSAIEEACFIGPGKEVEVAKFGMPQGSTTYALQAAAKIKMDADPEYLLYYEAFPIGEAVSWETYLHDGLPQAIVFAQIDYGDAFTREQFLQFKEDVRAKALPKLQELGIENYEIAVNNIILPESTDLLSMEPARTGGIRQNAGAGKRNPDGTFVLSYSPSDFNKTLVKYMACGAGSLCVKTPAAVYTLPLKNCAAATGDPEVAAPAHIELNAKAVSLYDAIKGIITPSPAGLVLPVLPADIYALDDKDQSNFYLNSPCQIDKITVRVGECTCDKYAKYPLYSYDGEKFYRSQENSDYSYICMDGMKREKASDEAANEKPPSCVIVETQERQNGGCYTYNPPFGFIPETPAINDRPTPVKDNVIAVEKNIFIYTVPTVKPSEIAAIWDRIRGKAGGVTWQWPWSAPR